MSNTQKLRIIAIEGNIGSGKTTTLEALHKEIHRREKDEDITSDYIFLEEPLSSWNTIHEDGKSLFQLFYEDPKKYAFSFQMMVLQSRIESLIEISKTNYEKTIIMERSLHSQKYVFADMMKKEGFISDVEYQVYNRCYDYFAKLFPVEKVILLDCPVKHCLDRVVKRNREGEEKMTTDYLETCEKKHTSLLRAIYNKEIVNADGKMIENIIVETSEDGPEELQILEIYDFVSER